MGDLKLDTYILKGAGVAGAPGDDWAVRANDMKWNAIFNKWDFCSPCGNGGQAKNGEFVEIGIKIKGKGASPAPRAGGKDFDLGGGVELSLSDQVLVGQGVGARWVAMPDGYPNMDGVGQSVVFQFRFPRDGVTPSDWTGLYDPLVGTGSSVATATDNFLCSTTSDAGGDPVAIDTECRAAVTACDIAETCDGASLHCPADVVAAAGTLARAADASFPCDADDFCTGADSSLPEDSFAPDTKVARPAAGLCDAAEFCSGFDKETPADAYASSSAIARPAVSVCDVAEMCTGDSPNAPADEYAPQGTVARAAKSACDDEEVCDGSSATVLADVVKGAEVLFRAAATACDVADYCSGSDGEEPDDVFATADTVAIPATDRAMLPTTVMG